MNALALSPALLVATLVPRLDAPDSPERASLHEGACATQVQADGTFRQTGISSLEIRTVGPLGLVTLIDQTSFGEVTGTISGTFEDDLLVVVMPGGRFFASFTLTVDATVGAERGVLTLQAWDQGQQVGPTTGEFEGAAVVTGSSGELAGTLGVLAIEGTVDMVSGLSTYSYDGTLCLAD